MCCHPSGTACSKMDPPHGPESYQGTYSSVVSSLHRCKSLLGACTSTGFSQVQSLPSGTRLLCCGSPPRAADGSWHHLCPPGAAGALLLNHGLHRGLQESLNSSTQSTSSSSFSADSKPNSVPDKTITLSQI